MPASTKQRSRRGSRDSNKSLNDSGNKSLDADGRDDTATTTDTRAGLSKEDKEGPLLLAADGVVPGFSREEEARRLRKVRW